MRSLLVIWSALAFAACGNAVAPLTNEDFAPELNVDLETMTQTSSGLYYQDITAGSGEVAVVGDVVSVHYEGFLPNGTKFDSSRDLGTPLEFTLGSSRLIAGFNEGIAGMRVGGMRKLVIPPSLAYGEQGVPPTIPENATLVFDIELLAVNP
jgi:FKBP-type peptidyl-prolyl cis-trans isomerase